MTPPNAGARALRPDRLVAPPLVGGSGALPTGVPLVWLALVGGVVPIVLAWHFGALGIPRNDDWAFARSAFRFADSAKISGSTWAGMNLVGQLVVSYPVAKLFGHRIAALQIEVAAIGVVGLLATLDLATHLLSPRRALFVALLVAALPMWPSLSASFMTDVPAFAFAMVSLALGARGVARDGVRLGYLDASLAVGLLAFTVRENAIVAPIVVGLVTVWVAAGDPRRRIVPIIAAIGGFVASAAVFYAWRRGLPGFVNATPRLPTLGRLGLTSRESAQSVLLVGFLASPAVALANPFRLLRDAWDRAPGTTVISGLATAGGLTVEMLRTGVVGALIPGDYFLANGTLGTEALRGTRPDLVPRSLLAMLAGVGAIALIVLMCAAAGSVVTGIARARRSRFGPPASPVFFVVALAAAGYAVSCVVPVAVGYTYLFDRYLLPIVPLVAILALSCSASTRFASSGPRVAGGLMLVGLAALGAVYGANAASFDGVKWRVAQQAVTRAGDPRRVDAGHIWNDDHAGKRVRGSLRSACIVLRAEPRPATGEAGVVGAGAIWGPTGTQAWVVARQSRPC